MEVYLNSVPLHLMSGMTVRHALVKAGLLKELESGKKMYDEWGNEIGLEGALSEGSKIFLR